MAKKNLDKIVEKAEEETKNLSGVNALFATKKVTKQKKNDENKSLEPLKSYCLLMDKSLFKNLDLRRVETGISIKDQILDAVKNYYNIH